MATEITTEITMPYGNFKGHTISALPDDYLRWVAENWSEKTARDKAIIKAADEEWQYRQRHDIHVD